jgi:hypothetical protein
VVKLRLQLLWHLAVHAHKRNVTQQPAEVIQQLLLLQLLLLLGCCCCCTLLPLPACCLQAS